MIFFFGHLVLLGTFFLVFLSWVFLVYILKIKSITSTYFLKFKKMFYFSYLLYNVAFLLLYFNLISSNFLSLNFLEHSRITQHYIYKFSALWSFPEGSLFLWCWFLLTFSYIFFSTIKCLHLHFLSQIFNIQLFVFCLFLFNLLLFSNPFQSLNFLPLEGLELNPMLQDILLTIHPPLIFLGYSGAFVGFSLGLSFLLFFRQDYFSKILFYSYNLQNVRFSFFWLMQARFWLLLTWWLLTFGLFLGSFWAFYELGWGTWWLWDPVENVSLIPWLFYTIILHLIYIELKVKIVHFKLVLFLILSFFFSLVSTLFVRSGFSLSIHNFLGDSIQIWLFFWLIASLYFYLFINLIINYRSFFKKLHFRINKLFFLQPTLLIFINVLLIFTTYIPVISVWFLLEEIVYSNSFYNFLFLPIFLSLFMSINFIYKTEVLALKYTKFWTIWLKEGYSLVIISLLFALLGLAHDNLSFLVLSYFSFSKYFLLTIFLFFIFNLKITKAFIIIHLSFFFFLFSVFSDLFFEVLYTKLFTIGKSFDFFIYKIILRNVSIKYKETFESVYGNFLLFYKNKLLILFPERRYYFLQGLFITKSAVFMNFYNDLIISLGDGSSVFGWQLALSKSFFRSWLWGSFCLLLSQILFRLFSLQKQSNLLLYLIYAYSWVLLF